MKGRGLHLVTLGITGKWAGFVQVLAGGTLEAWIVMKTTLGNQNKLTKW